MNLESRSFTISKEEPVGSSAKYENEFTTVLTVISASSLVAAGFPVIGTNVTCSLLSLLAFYKLIKC
jgi:hypothetical protein